MDPFRKVKSGDTLRIPAVAYNAILNAGVANMRLPNRLMFEPVVNKEKIPRNEFLTTKNSYRNFILTLECKALTQGCNGGIQFRSVRIPNNHEMIGYQADMTQDGTYWGCLHDESRRNKFLAVPDRNESLKVFKKDDWNRYEIRREGKRIRIFLNGFQTVDYTEEEPGIPTDDLIGLQIHGGPPSETCYRNIVIEEQD